MPAKLVPSPAPPRRLTQSRDRPPRPFPPPSGGGGGAGSCCQNPARVRSSNSMELSQTLPVVGVFAAGEWTGPLLSMGPIILIKALSCLQRAPS